MPWRHLVNGRGRDYLLYSAGYRFRRRGPARMMLRRKRIAPTGRDAPDYSRFLFAEIWTEQNGMPLRVVSALARLNLEASREASRLATLPRLSAALILSQAIARLPDRPVTIEVAAIAARLVKLLPDMRVAADAAAARLARHRVFAGSRTTWQIGLILVLACLLAYAYARGAKPAGDADAAQPIHTTRAPSGLPSDMGFGQPMAATPAGR